MHSHILPGLDDGAADWELSLAMARVAVEDGITDMLCTPHWVVGKYENDRGTVVQRLSEFRQKLEAEAIALKIYPGMELRLDAAIPERLKSGQILSVNDNHRYVLLEFPSDDSMPDNIDDFFWNLQISGCQPILSHVERNPWCRNNPQALLKWVEKGILTQITAMSLLGDVGEEIHDFSNDLIRRRLVHMVVTDTHNLRARKPVLSAARRAVETLAGPEMAASLFLDNPRAILSGAPVHPPEPLPPAPPKKSWTRFFFK
jgi:protein-tyrosine phosphatase